MKISRTACEQMTRRLLKYTFFDFLDFYDTQGFDEEKKDLNFIEIFKAILEGRAEEGLEFDNINSNAPIDGRRRMQIVIFLLSEDEGSYEKFGKLYKVAQSMGIICSFAATKLDEKDNDFYHEDNIDLAFETATRNSREIEKKMFRDFDKPEDNLNFIFNYNKSSNARCFVKENSAWIFLSGLLDRLQSLEEYKYDPFKDEEVYN